MSRVDQVYAPALEGKNIPLLPLDERWQQLFALSGKTEEIQTLESALTEKLEVQSALREKVKELKRLKKKLLEEIVLLRDPASTRGRSKAAIEKEIQDHKRLIGDCNERLESYEDELMDMPREIYQLDYKLMLATMNVCYQLVQRNTDEIQAVEEWIEKVRNQLQKNVLILQEKEVENFNLYSFMRTIFGSETERIFEFKYDPEKKHPTRGTNRR
ncbi:MAG: hypothetical protein IJT34_07005 [Butyrivibrio sp.]|nr:hypothetical protein [Butyrivibrio sp.]